MVCFSAMRARLYLHALAVLAALLLCAPAFAGSSAMAPHLRVELIPSPESATSADARHFTAGLHFQLDRGWHVYWSNAGDSGEPPAISWRMPPGFVAGPLQFPAPRRLPLGPLMDFGYENDVLFPVLITMPEPGLQDAATSRGHATLTANVSWLVCREACIPGKAQLTLDLPFPPVSPEVAASRRQLFTAAMQHLPQPPPPGASISFTPQGDRLVLTVLTGRSIRSAQFFPLTGGVIQNAAPQPVRPLVHGVELTLTKDDSLRTPPTALEGVLVVDGDAAAYQIRALPGAPAAAGESSPQAAGVLRVLRAAGLALLGGILLNLMPCVFPVLFIKGLALVQSSTEERRRMRAQGLVYTLGILVSFWLVVALLLALRSGGAHLGWGFQFQSPGFLALLALLLFFFALSLAGMFEFGLSFTGAGASLAARNGYAGSFFTGVLAMVVATPCTAPFMGAAIGFALAQPAGVTFSIFTALGVGLALPYLLLAFQPAWTRVLPRPGAWMELLKQATAIPVFATVIWIVWLFGQSAGVNALAGLLSGFLMLGVAAWTLGRWPARRAATVAASLCAALAVALPLYALRAFAGAPAAESPASPGGQSWAPWSAAAVAAYQQQGRPVFVDFTAKWCLSCQVNERVVLTRPDVLEALRSHDVALLRADWTRHDEGIGRALEALGRNGVPAYALYPGVSGAAPRLLPEVLTSGIVLDAVHELRSQVGAQTASAASARAGKP